MDHTQILQALINRHNYSSYLEIGVQAGKNFQAINILEKTGVDPYSPLFECLKITSDDFFAKNRRGYDIVFIDGDHREEQVYKDIKNAITILNPRGVIMVHDLNPTSELMQTVPRLAREWTGDGWRAWLRIRGSENTLVMNVVDTDYGCGLITVDVEKEIPLIPAVSFMTYSQFAEHKAEWLPLISVEQFKEKYLA